MAYDFDTVIDRRIRGAYKWNVKEHELPMWVADMDFQTAPEIIDALKARVDHGVFGYSSIPEEWNMAYVNWWKEKHHFEMDRRGLIFCTGVVPAISSIVRKLTTPAEKVVIQTPVYNIFYNSILNNGRVVLENKLAYRDGKYSIDFKDLEEKLKDPETSLMILCNPQNPAGKIWDKDTLSRIGELCNQYDVTVVSDEIHCDITDPGREYIPFASVSDICNKISITCISPTKCFNIAGLQTAAVYIPDIKLRHKVWRGLNTDEVAEPNAFAIEAAIAAFTKGENWLEELKQYIFDNKKYVVDFIQKEIPWITVVDSEATYLLWLDCTKLTNDSRALVAKIRELTGLYLANGAQYGGNGKFFMRLNIACPRELLREGMDRLKKAINIIITEVNH